MIQELVVVVSNPAFLNNLSPLLNFSKSLNSLRKDVASTKAERKETDCCICIYKESLPSNQLTSLPVDNVVLEVSKTGLLRQ